MCYDLWGSREPPLWMVSALPLRSTGHADFSFGNSIGDLLYHQLRTDGKVKTVNSPGVSSGLTVILDAQIHEYTEGRY